MKTTKLAALTVAIASSVWMSTPTHAGNLVEQYQAESEQTHTTTQNAIKDCRDRVDSSTYYNADRKHYYQISDDMLFSITYAVNPKYNNGIPCRVSFIGRMNTDINRCPIVNNNCRLGGQDRYVAESEGLVRYTNAYMIGPGPLPKVKRILLAEHS